MGIHDEDFSEEREAIANLTKYRGRLWLYYIATILALNYFAGDVQLHFKFVTSFLFLAIFAVHFDVVQGRIEALRSMLSQRLNSSELRAYIERKSR